MGRDILASAKQIILRGGQQSREKGAAEGRDADQLIKQVAQLENQLTQQATQRENQLIKRVAQMENQLNSVQAKLDRLLNRFDGV